MIKELIILVQVTSSSQIMDSNQVHVYSWEKSPPTQSQRPNNTQGGSSTKQIEDFERLIFEYPN